MLGVLQEYSQLFQLIDINSLEIQYK